jgi:hypothetical protein
MTCFPHQMWAGLAWRLPAGWKVRESNAGGGEIFHTRSERTRGPPSLLYHSYRDTFPRVKRPGCGVDYPRPSSAEVKERVELHLN